MRARLIYLLYRFLQAPVFPLLVVYLLRRGLRQSRYFRRLHERFGVLPRSLRQTPGGSIWLHAVSVGEVLSSLELLRRLRAEMPFAPVFVSTATLAGRALAEEKLRGLAAGVFYAPLDYCFTVRRVLRALRPQVVVVLETEIWPNLYRETKRAGCGLLVVNGRISDRALPRYRALGWFFREVLRYPDAVLVQNEVSRERYLSLGAPGEKLRVAGNLKYDFDPSRVAPPAEVVEFLARVRPDHIWIAASTMPPAGAGDPDEDEAVIEAFHRLAEAHPGLLLMLVPRRPERFETAAEALRKSGVPFVRRSALATDFSLALPGVLLVDTIGELSGLFQLAGVVFMGGTLVRRGGHNILEPAVFAKPVITGPHMENFPSIIEEFRAADAVVEITRADELAGAVAALLADPQRRAALGERARRVARNEQGATARAMLEIRERYGAAVPAFGPALPALVALWPLSRLWLAGGWLKRRLAQPVRLSTPVISIGNLTAGGTGKTPFVLWLAERLTRPAILTRGYRRRSRERCTVLGPGAAAPVPLTGDEAQIYLRAGIAPVGIAADRAAAGRAIQERFHPSVFLLDDGFQHRRLARSLDIVLIDALDPFGGGFPMPLGRLREPPRELARAGAIVLTRCEPGRDTRGLEARIREHNPKAPIFRSRVVPREWVDARAGRAAAVLPRVAAFCGLANPGSFWQTLTGLGVEPVLRRVFPDHHRYCLADLAGLSIDAAAAGAAALVTTEKDFVNLGDMPLPIPLYWLRIAVEVEDEAALLAVVRAVMR